MTNPWNLRETEVNVLSALCEARTYKAAARILGKSPKTIDNYTVLIRARMGVESTQEACQKWGQFTRGER